MSSAGTIAGTSRRLKEHNRLYGSSLSMRGFGDLQPSRRPAADSRPGVEHRSPPLLQHAIIDEVMMVSEAENIAACRRLLRGMTCSWVVRRAVRTRRFGVFSETTVAAGGRARCSSAATAVARIATSSAMDPV